LMQTPGITITIMAISTAVQMYGGEHAKRGCIDCPTAPLSQAEQKYLLFMDIGYRIYGRLQSRYN